MSTVSGVFPNAITPTFAASNDPAAATRQRRENENIVFSPIEELEQNSETRSSNIEQPGRLEAEYNIQMTAQGVSAGGELSEPVEMQDAVVSEPQGSSADNRGASQSNEMTDQEQAQLDADIDLIAELAARDREVRAHELSHQSVGGQYAGSMNFTYTTGPDGVRYAVGGEVSISVSEIPDDPEATLDKAQTIQAAALAPAEPSAQDRRVAALASQMAIEAQADIREQAAATTDESEEGSEDQSMSTEVEGAAEENQRAEEEQAETLAEANEQRLNDIMTQTEQTVRAALEAAYQARRPDQSDSYLIDMTV